MHEYMKGYMKKNVSEGIEAVKKMELEAFLYDAVILDYRAGQDDGCRLRVVGSWYSMTGYSIALNKGSKYKDMINRKLIEYAYSGDLERTQRFWFAGTCNKQHQDENSRNSQQFGLMQSSSVFILLASGIFISMCLLIFHQIYTRYLRDNFKSVWVYERAKSPTKNTSSSPNKTTNSVVSAFNCKNFENFMVIKMENFKIKYIIIFYISSQASLRYSIIY